MNNFTTSALDGLATERDRYWWAHDIALSWLQPPECTLDRANRPVTKVFTDEEVEQISAFLGGTYVTKWLEDNNQRIHQERYEQAMISIKQNS